MEKLPLFRMRYQRLEVRTCNENGTQNPPHTCIEVVQWHRGIPQSLCLVVKTSDRTEVRAQCNPLPEDLDKGTYLPFVEFAVDLLAEGGKFDVR